MCSDIVRQSVLLLLLVGALEAPAAISTSYIQFPHSHFTSNKDIFNPLPSPTSKINQSTRIKELRVLYSWRRVEFAFPTPASRDALILAGHYIPENAVILDSDYFSRGVVEKVIVTLPRMKPGIPATLAVVDPHLRAADRSPLLQPYPDWSWHGNNDCEGLISVFRTKVDSCGRLWVVDTGILDSLTTARRICPPKLLVFDLITDSLELKYVFPDNVLAHDTILVSIAVDVRNGCPDAFAYIADVTEFGLIVFDARTRDSWRVTHNYFYPFPTHGSFSIGGQNFDLMDGLMGLALSPLTSNGDKTLFFHSLASIREGKVSANLLRNESNFLDGLNRVSKKFYLSADVKPSQSAAQDMSRNKVLFFGLLTSSSIACWNAKLPFVAHNLVTLAQSNATLQFPSGVKVVEKNGREEVLITSSKFHSYFLGSLNPSDDNFHLLTASVTDLVKDTLCDVNFRPVNQRLLHH